MAEITGKTTINGVIGQCVVRVYSRETGDLVRETLSDPVTGVYVADKLSNSIDYDVLCFSNDGGIKAAATGPVKAVGGSYGDPHWANVVALLHFDGDFTDERGSIWTAHGGANTNATYSKFGTESGTFPKNTVSPLTTPDSPSFRLGTDDFTIEGWFLPEQPQYGFGAVFIKGLNTSNGISLGITPTSMMFRYSGTTGVSVNFPEITEFTHIAVVRENGVVGLYVGGQELLKQPITFDHTSTDLVHLGSNALSGGNSGYSYGGYIDDFRITKGVARYTEDFTPPTEPFPNVAPTVSFDLHWDKVVSLLHFDGDISDQKDKQWFFTGSNPEPGIITTPVKFGSGALDIPSNGSLTTTQVGDLDFGVGDFTLEFFLYTRSFNTATPSIIATGGNSWSPGQAILRIENGVGLVFYVYSIPGQTLIDNQPLPFDTWVHIAITRKDGTFRLFKQGLLVSENPNRPAVALNLGSGGSTIIGGSNFGNASYDGVFDEFRITKGVARYTEDFTPPVAPFPEGAP